MWEVVVRLPVAGGVFGGNFLCCSFSRGVSWMGSGTELSQFLRGFPIYSFRNHYHFRVSV